MDKIKECHWINMSPSLQKGIQVLNQLDAVKFEQFLKRISGKLKIQHNEIFSEQERQKLEIIFKVDESSLLLTIKTVAYLWKRLIKFVFKPLCLKTDLCTVGLTEEKANLIIKVWSSETTETLNNLGKKSISRNIDTPDISWHLNIELCSVYNKKQKIPKAYLTLLDGNIQARDIELTHPEIYSTFLQFEAIQAELDAFM